MSFTVAGPYDQLAAPTRRGLSKAFCQRQTGKWDPNSGWTFDQEFRGLSEAAMQSLANLYANQGIAYEITIQAGIATLRTMDTTGTVTIDVWEINASRSNGSVFGNPRIVSLVSANDLKVLTRAWLDGITPKQAVTRMNATTPPPSTLYTEPDVSAAGATKRLYDKTKNGNDANFFFDQYVLRHTTNASNRGYYNVADVNVNRTYTQSQFYSEIGNGSYWIFPAPSEIVGALNSIFSMLGSPPSNFTKGAVKGGSSRCTTANNRVNIVTEYLIGNIDNDNYDPAS